MENAENTPLTDRRPLGFWLRAVDGLLTRAIEAALAADSVDRREFMLLNAISGRVDAPGIADRIARGGKRTRALAARGWIAESDGRWALTDDGRAAADRLTATVDGIRSRVAGAVSSDDYATTLRTLEAIAAELGGDGESPLPHTARRHRVRGRHGHPHHGRGHDGDRGFGHEAPCGPDHRRRGERLDAYERGFEAGFTRGRDAAASAPAA